jgi:hypothetical protein
MWKPNTDFRSSKLIVAPSEMIEFIKPPFPVLTFSRKQFNLENG